MFKATEKGCHQRKDETDKPNMMPMSWISLVRMWTWDGPLMQAKSNACRTVQLASSFMLDFTGIAYHWLTLHCTGTLDTGHWLTWH